MRRNHLGCFVGNSFLKKNDSAVPTLEFNANISKKVRFSCN